MNENRETTMGFQWNRAFALVALPLALVACGGDGGASTSGGETPGTPVRAATVMADTVIDEIRATGEVEAVQSIELQPEVSGRLVEILVREGAEVRRGAGLFRVDDAELRAEVDRLEAEMELADQALARTRELLERDASSAADLERAEATARSTRAQLALQQTRLQRTIVRAPFAGEVGERFVSLGDYVTPATALTTLQTTDPQRASFQVPERYAQQLAEGQTVEFSVAAFPNRRFAATVDFVDPRVRLPGRTITVKAVAENPERILKPGMFVEARLATQVRPEALVVPEEAILPLGGTTYVWVITADGTVDRTEVELGVRVPGRVEVRSGLSAGDRVVTRGHAMLFPGATVRILDEAAEPGAGQAGDSLADPDETTPTE